MKVAVLSACLCLSVCGCSPPRRVEEPPLLSPSRALTHRVTVLVTSGDERLPGVAVTAFQPGTRPPGEGPGLALTNANGLAFLALPAGHWCLAASISGFVPIDIGVVISPSSPAPLVHLPLTLRPIGGDDFFTFERVVEPRSSDPASIPPPPSQPNPNLVR